MKKEIKRWAKFWAPGSFFAEDWTESVDSLDPNKIKFPENAYAFELYEREDIIEGKERYEGKSKKIGPTYYHPDSKIETLEQVRVNPKATGGCLVDNMVGNKWSHIIWTRWGNWPQPYDAKKIKVL